MEGKRISIPWATVALVLIIVLAVPWAVWADVFVWDGDIVTAGNQTTVNLGTVSPGATVTQAVSFQLQCNGKQHADQGQTVSVNFNLAGSTVPLGGSLSGTNASIGAIPASWPDDTTGGGSTNCPSPAPLLDDNGNSSVTITAPTAPGSYTFVVDYNSSLSPAGNGDSQAITGPNPSVTFNLVVQAPSDTTPPTFDCTVPDQTIWYASNQTVHCTASDPSGLKNPSDSPFDLSTSVAAATETASASTGSKEVCDIYDNCATAGPYTFKIDRKAPVVSCGSADSIWHATNQSVTCTASDGGSGLAHSGDASFSLSTSVATDTETDNAYTNSRVVADNVGNSYTAGPVGPFKIDRKGPQLSSCDAPDGAWHATNVTLYCHYTDGGSGPATQDVALSTSVAAGSETANAVASAGGAKACDSVGNCATSPADIAGNKVDKKAPYNITWSNGPADGSSYYFGFVPAKPTCSATDDGSGMASCIVTGYGTTVGSHTMTATATDNVGNVSKVTRSYTVLAWTLYGFYQPVDMPDPSIIWNTVKGGSTVPLKFEIFAGSELTDVSYVDTFVAAPVACPATGYVADEIEFSTTGGTVLRYDFTAGQFIQNWQTPKRPGSCYKVTVTTDDGSFLSAYFKLK